MGSNISENNCVYLCIRTVWVAPIHPLAASPRTGSCTVTGKLWLGGSSQDSLLLSLVCPVIYCCFQQSYPEAAASSVSSGLLFSHIYFQGKGKHPELFQMLLP